MRFFTPDLYLRFNSEDDQVADRADEEVEDAIRGYREHLQAIRPGLPPAVTELDAMNLHDAELLAAKEGTGPFPQPWPVPDFFPGLWWAGMMLALKRRSEVTVLLYALADPPRWTDPVAGWYFSPERTHWLYDEVDATDRRGVFVHRILFSDGRVLELFFVSVTVFTFALPDNAAATPNGVAARGKAVEETGRVRRK
jgi:hypothetical protein